MFSTDLDAPRIPLPCSPHHIACPVKSGSPVWGDGQSRRRGARIVAPPSQPHGSQPERPAVAGRISVDNVTLAFAALYQAMSLGEAERAERVIIGTPFRMIAYRTRISETVETFHFEIRPKALAG